MTAAAVKVAGCCFCGGQKGRPYRIEPFGYACSDCTDDFFTWRKNARRGWSALTDADYAKALAKNLGPPYRGTAVWDRDRDGEGKRTYGFIDPVRHLYAFGASVYWKAKSVMFGVNEWDQITADGSIRWLVGRLQSRGMSGYLVGTAAVLVRGRLCETEYGQRYAVPLDMFRQFTPDFYPKGEDE